MVASVPYNKTPFGMASIVSLQNPNSTTPERKVLNVVCSECLQWTLNGTIQCPNGIIKNVLEKWKTRPQAPHKSATFVLRGKHLLLLLQRVRFSRLFTNDLVLSLSGEIRGPTENEFVVGSCVFAFPLFRRDEGAAYCIRFSRFTFPIGKVLSRSKNSISRF